MSAEPTEESPRITTARQKRVYHTSACRRYKQIERTEAATESQIRKFDRCKWCSDPDAGREERGSGGCMSFYRAAVDADPEGI